MFVQIQQGIAYCHGENLIHRDLKLANILLTDKTAKKIKVSPQPGTNFQIIDFGVAGLQAGVHTDNDDPGTDEYLPPEVHRGLKNAVAPA